MFRIVFFVISCCLVYCPLFCSDSISKEIYKRVGRGVAKGRQKKGESCIEKNKIPMFLCSAYRDWPPSPGSPVM